jgi:hypothetical protein
VCLRDCGGEFVVKFILCKRRCPACVVLFVWALVVPLCPPQLRLSKRRITVSTCFSGVGAPETACAIIQKTTQRILVDLSSDDLLPGELPMSIRYDPTWVMDVDNKCRQELALLPHAPDFVFGDVLECVAPKYRKAVGLDSGREWSASRLREVRCADVCCLGLRSSLPHIKSLSRASPYQELCRCRCLLSRT